MTDLSTSTNFYFLNQKFEVIHKLTQYESLMWVDKYDEPGSFEIYLPPTEEIKMAAKIDNYFMSDKSEHLMIIEKLETTVSPENGERLIVSGRSLESILDRRVIFLKTYFTNKKDSDNSNEPVIGSDNLEDAVRQLLDVTFMHPKTYDPSLPVAERWVDDPDRAVPNFIFQYSDDDQPITDSNNRIIVDSNQSPIMADAVGDYVSAIELKDCEFDIGDNVLNIVNTIVQSARLGYKITLDSNHNFVFSLYKGLNRTSSQLVNPAVIFSPKFNNIKNTKFTFDSGENFRNFVYTEGEAYKNAAPTIVKTGEETGLLRREVYVTAESVHETEAVNVTHSGIQKTKKKLTEEEYQTTLAEEATKYFKAYAAKTTLESEVEPRLTFQYGRDFHIGDILEVQDGTGNKGEIRCVEFIISHSTSGYEEYPTFKNVTDEEETPSQTTASSGEFTDSGSDGGQHQQGDLYHVICDTEGSNRYKVGSVANFELKDGLKFTLHITNANSYNGALFLNINSTGNHLLYINGNPSSYSNKTLPAGVYECYYNDTYYYVRTDSPFAILPSYVGMIIQSTVLNTEAKVIHTYGGSSWIQHTGYILRGATSNVTANQAQKDGGADTHELTISEMPSHTHTQNAHKHYVMGGWAGAMSMYQGGGGTVYNCLRYDSAYGNLNTGDQTATNQNTGGGTANVKGASFSVQNSYKNIYIWERTA